MIVILLVSVVALVGGACAVRRFREHEEHNLSWHRYATQSSVGFRELNLFAGIVFYKRWQENLIKRWCAAICVAVGAAGITYVILASLVWSEF